MGEQIRVAFYPVCRGWARSSAPVRLEGQVAVWDPQVLESLVQSQRFFRVVTAPGP